MSSERLYARGRIWWCWYYDADGAKIQRSTRCRDKRAAERVAARFEREAADPSLSTEASGPTLKAALETMISDRETRGCAAGTLDMYRKKCGPLLRILGDDTPLARAATAANVDDYCTKRLAERVKRTTIARELCTLRVTLKVAARRGTWKGSVEAVMPDRWAADYEPRRRHLRDEAELELLLAELPAARARWVAFVVATGARDSEADRARREDVDLDAGLVRIRGTKTEGSAATIPVVPHAGALLRRAVEGVEAGPLFVDAWGNVRRDLNIARKRAVAKLRARADRERAFGREAQAARLEADATSLDEQLSPNDLRRTCATWLRERGASTENIAGILRHVDARMVERVYGKLAPKELGESIRRDVGPGRKLRRVV